MRKLKLQTQLSVDGFAAGPNGEMDWIEWNWDDKLKKYVSELTEPVDTILLGRVLAQGFIPHWTSRLEDPETADSFSKKMVNTPKIVFTKTLESTQWAKTRLAKGDLKEEINKLKSQDGKDIIAYGGSNFVSNLIQDNLIDEYHLFINPVLLGAGMSIFKNTRGKISLKLINSISFECGINVLCYEPKRTK